MEKTQTKQDGVRTTDLFSLLYGESGQSYVKEQPSKTLLTGKETLFMSIDADLKRASLDDFETDSIPDMPKVSWSSAIGHRVLFRYRNNPSTIFEADVTEASPSGRLVKLSLQPQGYVKWVDVNMVDCLEIID